MRANAQEVGSIPGGAGWWDLAVILAPDTGRDCSITLPLTTDMAIIPALLPDSEVLKSTGFESLIQEKFRCQRGFRDF